MDKSLNLPTQKYNGLAIIRLLLALLVTWSHCYPLTGEPGRELIGRHTHIFTGGRVAVFAFFFLSGILITKSWINTDNFLKFSIKRISRIWPALLAALLLTVCIVSISTKSKPKSYIAATKEYLAINSQLYKGIVYTLPAAFSNNPYKGSVNGSLWTLPWELRAYIFILIIGWFGILKSRNTANIALLLAFIPLLIATQLNIVYPWFDNMDVNYMLGSFIIGALVYINKNDQMSLKNSLILLGLGLVLLKLFVGFETWGWILIGSSFLYLLITQKYVKINDLKFDISYGVYVYSFPIQQFFVWLLPGISPLRLFLIVTPIILLISYISWNLIEKPSLLLGKKINSKIIEYSKKFPLSKATIEK